MTLISAVEPRRASFDLEYLHDLESIQDRVILVSERTLYLLFNLVNLEVPQQYRYAVEYVYNGYIPVEEGDALFALYKSVVEQAQLEVYDVTETITDLLEDIKARALPTTSFTDAATTSGQSTGRRTWSTRAS